ncbi:RDD family protein [Candidatus Tiddalikarchaeum anstoanum]|nr:RDD family protein [Candidatus Tiddalikarchaeum anstoanum]
MDEYKIVLPERELKSVASLQKRGLALIVDILIFFFFFFSPFISIFYYCANLPIDKADVESIMANDKIFSIILVSDFVAQFAFFFYLVSFEYVLGYTLGKKLLNLNVESANKGKPSLQSIIIRNLSKSIFWTVLVFDVIPAFLDARRRRISDFLAQTIVVESRKIIKRFPAVETV